MKEITRIHLAATPFNAEVYVRKELEIYLAAIEKSLQADEDAMREIEARIVELLAERGVIGEKVITADDLAAIKNKLGSPGEFMDEQGAEGVVHADGDKRLMRDQEGGILGGVLSGISAYVGIDPIWLRLLAVVLAFVSFGTALLVYVILWITMPAAKTAAEKLQMRGKPVTLEAIKSQSQVMSIPSEGRKVAVVMLRAIVGSLFVVTAVGAFALTVGSLFVVGVRLDDIPNSFYEAWIFVGLGLAVISGLLFVVLNSLLAYATFAWRFPRRVAVSCIAVVVAGIISFSGAIGAGVYGTQQLDQQLKAMTYTKEVNLATELTGVKSIIATNKGVPIEYRVTTDAPRAEMKVVSDNGKVPKIDVKRTGAKAELSVQDIKDTSCDEKGWDRLCLESISVVIYGPALDAVEARTGRIEYLPQEQSMLSVTTNKDATVLITGGSIEKVEADVADGSSFDADNSSVREANITIRSNSVVAVGVVASLDLTAPESCPANSKAEVSIARAASLRMNSQPIVQAAEINGSCTRISIDELQGQVLN